MRGLIARRAVLFGHRLARNRQAFKSLQLRRDCLVNLFRFRGIGPILGIVDAFDSSVDHHRQAREARPQRYECGSAADRYAVASSVRYSVLFGMHANAEFIPESNDSASDATRAASIQT